MMKQLSLAIDHNFREIVPYGDPSFPLEIWTGDMPRFVNCGLPLHWHPEFEYAMILKGRMVYGFQEYSIELGPGDCLFVNADRLHYTRQAHMDDPVLMYTIAFLPSLLAGGEQTALHQKYILPVAQQKFHGLRIEPDNACGQEVHRLLGEIYQSRAMEAGFELHALSLLYRLWLETLRYLEQTDLSSYSHSSAIASRDEACIKRALAFIHAHYGDKLTVDNIASAACISRNSCFRYFRSCFGKSPLEVLNEHRLSVAASLLSTGRPITEIAISCGFGSSSYFTKLFHSKFGMTPQQYRRQQ